MIKIMILFNDITFNIFTIMGFISLFALIVLIFLIINYLCKNHQKEKERKLITAYIERKDTENARIKL